MKSSSTHPEARTHGIASRFLAGLRAAASAVIITMIQAYQLVLRPLLIGSCKFCPSCSEYAILAVRRHGPLRGGWLAVKRLARCHPFSPGGVDPVPE